LNTLLTEHASPVLINLASKEYFKAIRPDKLAGDVIHVTFMDAKNGTFKVLSFFAKKARGAMARFMIQNRLEEPEQLKGFDWEGYAYNDRLSENNEWVFTRN